MDSIPTIAKARAKFKTSVRSRYEFLKINFQKPLAAEGEEEDGFELKPLDLYEYVDYVKGGKTMSLIMKAQVATSSPQRQCQVTAAAHGAM